MVAGVGQQLGNYRLIQLLGQGNWASVYLGQHIHLNTQAAIKVLHGQLTSQEVAGFLTEARTRARLRHPHIVQVLDFGVETQTPFLVMDYAPGGTLRQRHPTGTHLPLDTVLTYVRQVAEALQYAHQEKLIHRDIKPENMLLGRNDEVLLSDFGIAIMVRSSHQQPPQDTAGTIAYMAPEQLQGKPRPQSDQYALGIVVYEWVCGERPFHGTSTELYGQHLFLPPPRGIGGSCCGTAKVRVGSPALGGSGGRTRRSWHPSPPIEVVDYERSVSAARVHLGERAFAAAWAQGRAMTAEQALAAKGQKLAPPPITTVTSSPTHPAGLTVREVEVLRLVATGLTDLQIADKLILSPRTVHAHISSIYSKLAVTSRSAATRYAIEHHLA